MELLVQQALRVLLEPTALTETTVLQAIRESKELKVTRALRVPTVLTVTMEPQAHKVSKVLLV
tara:strand:+ start:155 stop:343 length:189 start_codon:yes stop_codon:yes gene_type:complete